jgi:hypothetical protein
LAAPVALHCRFTVTEAKGCRAGDIAALFESTRAHVEGCRGATGKLVVRVYEEEGKLKFHIEPGSSLDATQSRCVLEALTTVAEDGAPGLSTGPSLRPTGFSSLLTIEW